MSLVVHYVQKLNMLQFDFILKIAVQFYGTIIIIKLPKFWSAIKTKSSPVQAVNNKMMTCYLNVIIDINSF